MPKKPHVSKEDFTNIYFNDETQAEIFNIFRSISENTGANYMSYLYENFDKNVRYAFTTNPDWGKYYVGENKIDNCHMWLNVTRSFVSTDMKKYILLWDTLKPETRKQRNVYFDRTDHEIGTNGISFCSKFENSSEILGLAPDLKTPRFQSCVSKNINAVRSAVSQIRKKLSAELVAEQTNNLLTSKKNT